MPSSSFMARSLALAQISAMRLLVPMSALALAASAGAQSVAVATSSGPGHHHSSVTMTVAMGKAAQINGMWLRPIAVVEDSRCPSMVACVWRGRLVIQVERGRLPPLNLEDGKPISVSGGRLTLVDAGPRSKHGEKVPPSNYRFILRFERS
jgi:hypothetical protein